MKINITHNFTSMVTGHENMRSYLHRFKILETSTCPCGTEDQTVDHFSIFTQCNTSLLFDNCIRLHVSATVGHYQAFSVTSPNYVCLLCLYITYITHIYIYILYIITRILTSTSIVKLLRSQKLYKQT
jgi:hypothetical protein